MAKASTKSEMIQIANDNFNKMWCMINSLSQSEKEQNFTYDKSELTKNDKALHWNRDNNLRDVLAHLYEWHLLVLNWVASNEKGVAVPFLPKPYNWTNYQQMNIGFFELHQNTTLETASHMVTDSHKKVMDLIEKFTDTELFEKKHFSWTGTTSLGQYFHSATIAHYDWAMKKLKAYQKALKSK